MGERAGGSAGTHVVHAVEKLAERCGDGGARVLHEDAVADVLEGLVEARQALQQVLEDEVGERGAIGTRLRECLAAIARQSATIDGCARSLSRAEQAALAKAFRGELVP